MRHTQVEAYLAEVRSLVAAEEAFLVHRGSAADGLRALYLSKRSAVQQLRMLTCENYCLGPVPNGYRADQFDWTFGDQIAGVEACIELSIENLTSERRRLKVLSFRPAHTKLTYPLRKLQSSQRR